MWLWAWFLAGGWILVAGGLVWLGAVAAAVVVGATARKRDYAGRHVLGEYVEPYGFIESMDLDDDRRALEAAGYDLPLFYPAEPAPWLEQTQADLSPETLDPGPGAGSSLTPGPDLTVRLSCGHIVTVRPGDDVPECSCQPTHAPPFWTWDIATDLGPRAAWVLGCYERRHQEKWAWAAMAA